MKEIIKQISITARIIFSCFVAITVSVFVDNFRRYKWACFFIIFVLDGKLDNSMGVRKRTG